MNDPVLDDFGRFIAEHLRDRGIHHAQVLVDGAWNAPSLQRLQADLRALTTGQREAVVRTVVSSIDAAVHDFLFAIQEANDDGEGVQVHVRGAKPASRTDGLHGEIFTNDGWFARYSAFGEPPEEA